MGNKAFSKIWIIVIILILAGGGFLGLQYFGKDETADWNTYKNEEYGFAIKYPKDWYVYDVGETLFGITEEIFSEVLDISELSVEEFQWPAVHFTSAPLEELEQDVEGKHHDILIEIKEKFSSIDEWLKSWKDYEEKWKEKLDVKISIEEINVGKERGYKVTKSLEGGKYTTTYIGLSKGQKVYEIRQITPDECIAGECKVFNQMLSTFRFLD